MSMSISPSPSPSPPTRRRFRCNRALSASDTAHFMVPCSRAELAPIHAAVCEGRVINIVGPRQAGKTTLVHAIRALYPNHVFVSGERSLATLRELPPTVAWTVFNTAVWRAAREASLPTLVPETKCFLSSSTWMASAFSAPPLLIIDEFDMVAAAGADVLDPLLRGLRAMLPSSDSSAALAAVIVVGPPAILDVITTGGTWNDLHVAFTPRRFNVPDLRVLLDEWTNDEGVPPVSEAVLEDVIALTLGHRGWSMLLCDQLTRHIKENRMNRTRLERVLAATGIVDVFLGRLTALGMGAALQAAAAVAGPSGAPANSSADVRVVRLLTDVGALVPDGTTVRILLCGPSVFARAVDTVIQRLSACDMASPRRLHEMSTAALLASVSEVQQDMLAAVDGAVAADPACALTYVFRAWLGCSAVIQPSNTVLRINTATRKFVCYLEAPAEPEAKFETWVWNKGFPGEFLKV